MSYSLVIKNDDEFKFIGVLIDPRLSLRNLHNDILDGGPIVIQFNTEQGVYRIKRKSDLSKDDKYTTTIISSMKTFIKRLKDDPYLRKYVRQCRINSTRNLFGR